MVGQPTSAIGPGPVAGTELVTAQRAVSGRNRSGDPLQGRAVMQIPRIDPKNVLGLADKMIGLGKEIVGTVTNRGQLSKAGQVQQEKGTERVKAVQSETKAKAHKARAATAETAQRSAQKTKERTS